MTANSPENRYARQQQFAPISADGQTAIRQSDVAILGCGALGTVAAEILARAGVGRLRLIDRDVVEWTNLQRQSLYLESDAQEAAAKADAAARRLSHINSEIQLHPEVTDVTPRNIDQLLSGCDLVIDAADNFPLRFLLNDWSLENQTPWVHGGCIGATGQVRLFTGNAPCFRCLVPNSPPIGSVQTCDTAGVVGSATHLISSLQATEAIKWLSGNRDTVRSEVLSIDLWNNRIREIALDETLSHDCPTCASGDRDYLRGALGDEHSEIKLCGRDAVQIASGGNAMIDFAQFESAWQTVGTVKRTRFFVRLHLDANHTLTLFRDGRAMVTGTEDIARAKSIYAMYVGT